MYYLCLSVVYTCVPVGNVGLAKRLIESNWFMVRVLCGDLPRTVVKIPTSAHEFGFMFREAMWI